MLQILQMRHRFLCNFRNARRLAFPVSDQLSDAVVIVVDPFGLEVER
jgi:hypothetical protein